MAGSMINIYECSNPDCQLRFPGAEGHPRWNRCPICRSRLGVVAQVEASAQKEGVDGGNQAKPQLEAMLDNIRSAWNVGSIFRTADGLGIRKLYLCGITPSPENIKVRKTALGAESAIAWEKANNGVNLASRLRTAGYRLWALEDLPGAQELYQIETDSEKSPVVLIAGNEVSGIDPGIIALCEKVIAIPMAGRKQSYNVAVAFGIAASFLLYRQSVSHGSLRIFPST